jgi:hypothetical protein
MVNEKIYVHEPPATVEQWEKALEKETSEIGRLQIQAHLEYIKFQQKDGNTPSSIIQLSDISQLPKFAIKKEILNSVNEFGSLSKEREAGGLPDHATVKSRKGANKRYFNKLPLDRFLQILKEHDALRTFYDNAHAPDTSIPRDVRKKINQWLKANRINIKEEKTYREALADVDAMYKEYKRNTASNEAKIKLDPELQQALLEICTKNLKTRSLADYQAILKEYEQLMLRFDILTKFDSIELTDKDGNPITETDVMDSLFVEWPDENAHLPSIVMQLFLLPSNHALEGVYKSTPNISNQYNKFRNFTRHIRNTAEEFFTKRSDNELNVLFEKLERYNFLDVFKSHLSAVGGKKLFSANQFLLDKIATWENERSQTAAIKQEAALPTNDNHQPNDALNPKLIEALKDHYWNLKNLDRIHQYKTTDALFEEFSDDLVRLHESEWMQRPEVLELDRAFGAHNSTAIMYTSLLTKPMQNPNMDVMAFYAAIMLPFSKKPYLHWENHNKPLNSPEVQGDHQARKGVIKQVFSKKKFTIPQQHALFERLHNHGFLEIFAHNLENHEGYETLIPKHIQKNLRFWANHPDNKGKLTYGSDDKVIIHENIDDLIIDSLSLAEESVPEVDNRPAIPVIEVTNLLPKGEAEESDSLAEEFENEASPEILTPTEYRIEERDAWIEEALLELKDEIDLDKTVKYEDRLGKHIPSGETYHVFDVHLKNGERVQIAVNRQVGQGTYLWKQEFINYPDDAGMIDVEDLRSTLMVQPVRCVNKDSFKAAIQKLVLTPANQLKPVVKRHVYWKKAAHAIQNSVDAHIAQKNTPPKSNGGIIRHGVDGKGSLNLRSLWKRVDVKLEQKVIAGLEEFSSLDEYGASRMAHRHKTIT